MSEPRVLIIGDSFMPAQVFEGAFRLRGIPAHSESVVAQAPSWDVSRVDEFEGDPAAVSKLAADFEVVAFHAAPFTAEVFAATPGLRLLGCARGGPVNVDIDSALAHGVRVTTSPGKNAAAVADLTIGFIISVVRNVPASRRDVDDRVSAGLPLAESALEGARWFGRELASLRLGLVGFGNVARLVAARAGALGMTVSAFDPFVDPSTVSAETMVASLDELLATSDVLSLHARATAENQSMIGAAQIGLLPPGSFLVNTARESLVDESAVLAALRSGHLGGVALDVNEPDGLWREMVAMPNLILTPHIAGATLETLARGADMIASEVQAFLAGDSLRFEKS